MWLVSIRDLQWRRRRFIIGVLATSVLFAVTLILAGVNSNLRREATTTIEAVGADHWVVVEGTTGPVSGLSVMPMEVVDELAAIQGVERAEPLVIIRQAIRVEGRELEEDILLFASLPGGLATPDVSAGRGIEGPGEAVIDTWSGLEPGDRIALGSGEFEIVGTTNGLTMAGGISALHVTIEDAHAALFQGVPLIQSVLVTGTPAGSIDGFAALTPTDVIDDIMRPFGRMLSSFGLVSWLLWLAAAAVVGSIVFLTAIERTRDFAVLKAVGVGNASLFGGLALQAVLVSTAAALLSVVIARLLLPLFPTPMHITSGSIVLLVPVTVVVGLAASVASLRRVVMTDPALAFGGS